MITFRWVCLPAVLGVVALGACEASNGPTAVPDWRAVDGPMAAVVDTPKPLDECPQGATDCRTFASQDEEDAYWDGVNTFDGMGGSHCEGVALGLSWFGTTGRVRVYDNRIVDPTTGMTRAGAWVTGPNTVAVWSEILNWAQSGNSWTVDDLTGVLGEEGDHAHNLHLHDGYPDSHFLSFRDPSIACSSGSSNEF